MRSLDIEVPVGVPSPGSTYTFNFEFAQNVTPPLDFTNPDHCFPDFFANAGWEIQFDVFVAGNLAESFVDCVESQTLSGGTVTEQYEVTVTVPDQRGRYEIAVVASIESEEQTRAEDSFLLSVGSIGSECYTDADCPSGYCVDDPGRCVECRDDGDCGLGEVCVDGTCAETGNGGENGGGSGDDDALPWLLLALAAGGAGIVVIASDDDE